MQSKTGTKRKQPAVQTSGKKAQSSRQTKLTQLFAEKEQCPHCSQQFNSIDGLIDHVESAHLITAAGNGQPAAHVHTHASNGNDSSGCIAAATTVPELHTLEPAHGAEAAVAVPPLPAAADSASQQQHTAWWKQAPTDPIVAHIRYAGGSSSGTSSSSHLQPVRLSALSTVAPVQLVLQVLPAGLANSLLTELLRQSGAWVAGSWWFAGQQQTAPRYSATYSLKQQGLQHTNANSNTAVSVPPMQPPPSQAPPPSQQHTATPSSSIVASAAAPNSNPAAPSQDLASLPQLPAPAVLQQAAELVTQAVNSRMRGSVQHRAWQQQRETLTAQLLGLRSGELHAGVREAPASHTNRGLQAVAAAAAESAQQSMHTDGQEQPWVQQQEHGAQRTEQQEQESVQWRPSYVLANLYKDGQQSVGSHTDRLSSLGPLPTIASVSLGAGRVFRLHPADSNVAAKAAAAAATMTAGGSSGSNSGGQDGGGGGGRVVSSIDIQLPHNSLLIMWPPTQEEWKHEIPKTKKVTSHPLSGSARINLTFRQLQPAWAAAVPDCRCRRPAIMRCGLQGSQFVYYYACDNTKGPGCGLYKPAVALDAG